MAWTESRVEIARKSWIEGESASQIAKKLGGVTRNAVLSKLRRIGAMETQRLASPPRTTGQGKRPERRIRSVKRSTKFARPPVEQPSLIPTRNVPFVDVLPGECKAVTDATRYAQKCCGHPVDERGIYCAAHTAIFYTQSKGKGA